MKFNILLELNIFQLLFLQLDFYPKACNIASLFRTALKRITFKLLNVVCIGSQMF